LTWILCGMSPEDARALYRWFAQPFQPSQADLFARINGGNDHDHDES
jgi:hypothetical protein